jgi:hypothetical protein
MSAFLFFIFVSKSTKISKLAIRRGITVSFTSPCGDAPASETLKKLGGAP